jgi:hypothetical protein
LFCKNGTSFHLEQGKHRVDALLQAMKSKNFGFDLNGLMAMLFSLFRCVALANAGITAVIQPGGSIKTNEHRLLVMRINLQWYLQEHVILSMFNFVLIFNFLNLKKHGIFLIS